MARWPGTTLTQRANTNIPPRSGNRVPSSRAGVTMPGKPPGMPTIQSQTAQQPQQELPQYIQAGDTYIPWTQQSEPEVQYINELTETTRNMQPQDRMQYLQDMQQTLRDRLLRYQYHVGRGVPLDEGAQADMQSMQNSLNAVTQYINNLYNPPPESGIDVMRPDQVARFHLGQRTSGDRYKVPYPTTTGPHSVSYGVGNSM